MVSRLGVSACSRLHAHPHSGLVSGEGTPELVEGLAQLLAPHTRVKLQRPRGKQMQGFVSAPVDLCLESLVPEPAHTCPGRGETILQKKKARPRVAQGLARTEQDGAGLSLSWVPALVFSPVQPGSKCEQPHPGDGLSLLSPFWATSPCRLTSPPPAPPLSMTTSGSCSFPVIGCRVDSHSPGPS